MIIANLIGVTPKRTLNGIPGLFERQRESNELRQSLLGVA